MRRDLFDMAPALLPCWRMPDPVGDICPDRSVEVEVLEVLALRRTPGTPVKEGLVKKRPALKGSPTWPWQRPPPNI